MRLWPWVPAFAGTRKSYEQGTSFRQPPHQRARILARSAHLLHLRIELIDQGGDRQQRAVLLGLVEREAQVLAHPVDREAEVEAVLAHRLPAIDHLPALRRAARHRLEHLAEIALARLGEAQRLAQPLQHAGDRDLVDHLGLLPGARPADMDGTRREWHHDLYRTGESCGRAGAEH